MINNQSIRKALAALNVPFIQKIYKYVSYFLGITSLIIIVIFFFFPDPFINSLLKERIRNGFKEAYPLRSIQLGDLHYNFWNNRLLCESIIIRSNDSSFTCNTDSFSIAGLGWIKILLNGEFSHSTLSSSVLSARRIKLSFLKSQEELCFTRFHISLPHSEMRMDSIKYYSMIDDEQIFAKSKFRQTRYRVDIPQLEIKGLDYFAIFKNKSYRAKYIRMQNIIADILVNMDKPYDVNSIKPQMPNEILTAVKENIQIDSLKITNGQLKYSERFAVKSKPGEIIFNKVNVLVNGISNHAAPLDTAIIHGDAVFMNAASMKLFMAIPLASPDFSLKYSGSLNRMEVTKLNRFIEPAEHQRIKSGIIHSAIYNINVHSGHAKGTLHVIYEDLSIAVLNKESGSEKGIVNRILSFFGKVFIIRGSNMPDENGIIKIGEIKYTRNPNDYFFQFLWFALRGSIADVVGFPRE